MNRMGSVLASLGLTLVVALAWPAPPLAQTGPGVGIVSTLTGDVTVRRAAAPEPVALRFKDDVFLRDRIATGQRSSARLLLGGGALVTVGELSMLTLGQEPDRWTADIASGKLGLALVRQRMRVPAAFEVLTPNCVVAVRGTTLVVQVAIVSGVVETTLSLLGGLLDVSLRQDPSQAPVRLEAGQTLKVTGNRFGPVAALSVEESDQLTADLRTGVRPHARTPSEATQGMTDKEQARAVELLRGLASPGTSTGGAGSGKPGSGEAGGGTTAGSGDSAGGTSSTAPAGNTAGGTGSSSPGGGTSTVDGSGRAPHGPGTPQGPGLAGFPVTDSPSGTGGTGGGRGHENPEGGSSGGGVPGLGPRAGGGTSPGVLPGTSGTPTLPGVGTPGGGQILQGFTFQPFTSRDSLVRSGTLGGSLGGGLQGTRLPQEGLTPRLQGVPR